MVETRYARFRIRFLAPAAAFRIRIRHRANTVLASHPPLIFFFSKYDVKISLAGQTYTWLVNVVVNTVAPPDSHLSYAEEGCYVNVKLCID